jgi:hypothetical protein
MLCKYNGKSVLFTMWILPGGEFTHPRHRCACRPSLLLKEGEDIFSIAPSPLERAWVRLKREKIKTTGNIFFGAG